MFTRKMILAAVLLTMSSVAMAQGTGDTGSAKTRAQTLAEIRETSDRIVQQSRQTRLDMLRTASAFAMSEQIMKMSLSNQLSLDTVTEGQIKELVMMFEQQGLLEKYASAGGTSDGLSAHLSAFLYLAMVDIDDDMLSAAHKTRNEDRAGAGSLDAGYLAIMTARKFQKNVAEKGAGN